MQQRQQSLFSFYSNNADKKGSSQCNFVQERSRTEQFSCPQTLQRQENTQNHFDLLKKKFLRAQNAPTNSYNQLLGKKEELSHSSDTQGNLFSDDCTVSRRGYLEKSRQDSCHFAQDQSLDEKTDFLACAQEPSCQNLLKESTQGRRHFQASSCRPSIPGIKRIHDEDYCPPLLEGSLASDPLKRRKLIEALGADEGLEREGAWAEAKAKFEWLHPFKIRDGKGRKPGDKHFDKRTLQIPADILNKMSASQKQYWITKSQYMDTILFFKVGKFYELYELDAEVGQKELNWKMIVSGVGRCRQVGVSEGGIDDAVQKLVARGYKVGRMEQLETLEQAKAKRGPAATVQRKLVHVSTPSTVLDESLKPEAVHLLALREDSHDASNEHFLRSGVVGAVIYGFAFVDAAVGRFYVGSLHDDSSRSALGALLTQIAPHELLYEMGGLSDETLQAIRRCSNQGLSPIELTPLQPNLEFMDASAAISMIQSHGYFMANVERSQGCNENLKTWLGVLHAVNDSHPVTSALGALVSHLQRMKLDEELLKNGVLVPYEVYEGSLRLDGQTLSNLEIFQNNADAGNAGTLINYLNSCATPFGKRLLRRWMCHPLQSIREINDRLDAVDELLARPKLCDLLCTRLRQLPDLERLVARLRGLAGTSDVATIPIFGNRRQQQKVKSFCIAVKGLLAGLDLLSSLHLGNAEGPPTARLLQTELLLEGMTEAHVLLTEIKIFIEKFSSTKLGAFKQEQYAGDLDDNEAQNLNRLIMFFNQQNGCWLLVAETLSRIDVLLAFASAAHGANGPTCRPQFVSKSFSPTFDEGEAILDIKGLWHPFATGGQGGVFVPNDIKLGSKPDVPRSILLTGPNMGGKSTLLRATCLAVILAQLGCHVPAESCILSPVDIIFTRFGSNDHIMSGESTFLVECMEAASVLRYATRNSLVVLDELGRGTSTFDGYAIAYAVFRHLVDTVNCRLLFATHYHPLTKEFAAHPSVSLQHMACAFQPISTVKAVNAGLSLDEGQRTTISSEKRQIQESVLSDKQLIFLYKLTSGACPASYGLQVALLAGMPRAVVKAAERASGMIKSQIATTFESVAHREHLSHIHEEWLKTIIATAEVRLLDNNLNTFYSEEDGYDTLLCIWHELQKSLGMS